MTAADDELLFARSITYCPDYLVNAGGIVAIAGEVLSCDHEDVRSSDVVSLMVSGEVAACFAGWTGIPTETAKQNVETIYTIPKEGAATWCDAWFMPPGADNEEAAYEFFNQAISPEVQAKVVTRNAAGVVSSKAVDLLPPETKALFDYSDVEGIFKAAPLLGIPPLESNQYATYADWVAAWNEFKAG